MGGSPFSLRILRERSILVQTATADVTERPGIAAQLQRSNLVVTNALINMAVSMSIGLVFAFVSEKLVAMLVSEVEAPIWAFASQV